MSAPSVSRTAATGGRVVIPAQPGGHVEEVLRLTAGGATTAVVAQRLGVAPDLVEAILDHAERLGLARRLNPRVSGCSGCAPGGAGSGPVVVATGLSVGPPRESRASQTGPQRTAACAGCPLARD